MSRSTSRRPTARRSIDQADAATTAADAEREDDNVTFDRMTEEDLLAGIEGLVPPEKSDDY